MIKRSIDIKSCIEKNKVLVVYGARQVGKTTLVNDFLAKTKLNYKIFTGDDLEFAEKFGKCDLQFVKKLLTGLELLVIDEAQIIQNIGRALKLVVDYIPNIFVIVKGSSSFDLANATDEPLTGRKNIVTLYPIAIKELLGTYTEYEIERNLSDYLIYGSYPNIITYPTYDQKKARITEIKDAYLIKDILRFQMVKNSTTVIKLLKLLAFQIGSEVSTLELGTKLGIDHKTVTRYLDLLEKSFVIFGLHGFSRNLRKEIGKMNKYYFYDLGIRNALISNFNGLDTRDDIGQLWENFIIMERLKRNKYKKVAVNYYFWRTYDQKEIDLVEEKDGKLYGYEFKWKNKDAVAPKDWLNTYKNAKFKVVSSDNFISFIK